MKLKEKYRHYDIVFNIYMCTMAVLLLVFGPGRIDNWLLHALKYVLVACVGNALVIYGKDKGIIGFFRTFYPMLIFQMNYTDSGRFAFMFFSELQDPLILNFERIFFPVQPVIFLERLASPLLTELVTVGYMAYYFILPILALLLFYRKKDIKGTYNLMLTVSITFYFCYLFFMILPVDGPWRYRPVLDVFDGRLSGYFLYPLQEKIMKMATVHSGCFPSSHVAVATVTILNARKYYKTLGFPYLIIGVLLFFATFYLRFHYLTDSVAGFLVGALFFKVISRYNDRWFEKKNTISSS